MLTEISFSQVNRLGPRAFLLFLLRQIKWSLVASIIATGLWFYRDHWDSVYRVWTDAALEILLLLTLAVLALKIMRAYFEYRGYAYRFENEFFHITRGYLTRQEIGVVYHQIQTVTLRHGISDRMIGVSNLVIVMNGNQAQPAEVILPALDRRRAQMIQQELLKQARLRATNIAQGGMQSDA